MSGLMFYDLPLKCTKCGANLVKLTDTKGKDWALCTECGAFNDAKEMIENSAGLIRGPLTPEQVIDLREKVRLARKKAN